MPPSRRPGDARPRRRSAAAPGAWSARVTRAPDRGLCPAIAGAFPRCGRKDSVLERRGHQAASAVAQRSVPRQGGRGGEAMAGGSPKGTSTATTRENEGLVTEHLPLVGHIARETASRMPRHLGTDDLVGAGSLALVQAAHSYDPSLGVPFARFANTRIRGAMIDQMRQRDWASRSLRTRAR